MVLCIEKKNMDEIHKNIENEFVHQRYNNHGYPTDNIY